MQWSALEKADPTDPTVLAKHLEALEKAKARCQERMANAVAKKLEQLSTSDEPRAGGTKHRGKSGQPRKAVLTPAAASSSSGLEKPTATLEKEGKKKKSKPAQDLEKSKPKDLEKCQGSTTHGSATKGLEKPVVVVDWHNTLEKDDVVSQNKWHDPQPATETGSSVFVGREPRYKPGGTYWAGVGQLRWRG